MTTATKRDVPDTMRALVLAEFGTVTIEDRPVPQPAPGEALIRVAGTGICGSDIHGYTGKNGRRFPGQVMGHETVGHVVAYGPRITHGPGIEHGTAIDHNAESPPGAPAIGGAVTVNPLIGCDTCPDCTAGQPHVCVTRCIIGVDPTISAAFAEYLSVPVANLVAWPATAPLLHGALVEPLAVGYHAARRAAITPGEWVLVIGAGPIGQAVILAALRQGAGRVFVSEPDPARRELAAAIGAHPIDPAGTDVVATVLGATGGRGVPVVIDAVGSARTVESGLTATARGGRCVLVGMGSPQVDVAAYRLSTDERSLIGSFCYTAEEFAETATWAAGHDDAVQHLISDTVTLEGAPEAFRALAAGTTEASKIVVAFP